VAVSGLGVAVATGGMLLIYGGLTGENPLDALRALASGHPPAVPDQPGSRSTTATINGSSGGDLGKADDNGFPQLLASCGQFDHDVYSEAHRWDPGKSDCSSYIGKGFKGIGIRPPGASTTLEYLAWSHLKPIAKSVCGPGDLLISPTHMAIVVNRTLAKGQQNPRSNVRTGSHADIMAGSASWGYYRYTAGGTVKT
jgi:cell wall-associated NlpC family hydrolase